MFPSNQSLEECFSLHSPHISQSRTNMSSKRESFCSSLPRNSHESHRHTIPTQSLVSRQHNLSSKAGEIMVVVPQSDFNMTSKRESCSSLPKSLYESGRNTTPLRSPNAIEQNFPSSSEETMVVDGGDENVVHASNEDNVANAKALGPLEKENQEQGNNSPAVEESMEERINRLGRQRPEVFKSRWAEIGFVFSISMSQVLSEYFVSGFTVILPTVARELNIPAASSTWPASAFSLTVASFLLVFGRTADMYGGYPVYVAGLIWLTVWSLVAGFSVNDVMLNFCRALQGLGPAAYLPSSVMILGSIYRPGPRKNIVFSIYGACAALGFFIGIFFAGVTAQYTTWGWYFWIGTVLSAITAITAYFSIPSDMLEKKNSPTRPKMDWLGAILIITGLILFTFAIIDSSHAPQRWNTPHIIALFILGSLLLLAAGYVEGYVAKQPLLPASLFKVPSMTALVIALFFTYGSLGIFLLYATFYMETVMGATPLQVVAWYVPMALGGCLISTFGGFILHLLPGTALIIMSGVSWIIAPLLFAIAPQGASYWAYIFPSMICATVGIDITFNVANIFITTALPQRQQGLAGAVIMLLLQLGIAVCLGFADIVNTYTIDRLGTRQSYHAVFWLEVAFAATALTILVFFVKINKAESEMTADEREAMELEKVGNERCGTATTSASSTPPETGEGETGDETGGVDAQLRT